MNMNIKNYSKIGAHNSGLVSAAKAKADAEAIRSLIEPLAVEGWSLQVIADQLNGWRVSGPRGGRWTACAVMRALDRLGIERQRRAA